MGLLSLWVSDLVPVYPKENFFLPRGFRKGSQKNVSIGNTMGMLRIRIVRGINLVVRDVKSNDPYVIDDWSLDNGS